MAKENKVQKQQSEGSRVPWRDQQESTVKKKDDVIGQKQCLTVGKMMAAR